MSVRVKHVSEEASPSDGTRVLVDRLWPRGRTKASLPLDRWCRDIAPSTELRQWFKHDPDKWEEFQRRYRRELTAHAVLVGELVAIAETGTLTLVFAASARAHNNAVALAAALAEQHLPSRSRNKR